MPALPPELKDWVNLIQWLATIALGVSVWLRKPGQDAGEAVAKLNTEIKAEVGLIANRVLVLEEHQKHVPTSSDVAELEGTVKAIAMQTSGLAEAISTMRVQLNRIEGYLLQAKDSRL